MVSHGFSYSDDKEKMKPAIDYTDRHGTSGQLVSDLHELIS